MDEGDRRITGTRLIDHDGLIQRGDFLLHSDGSYSKSKGGEDVVETIDGCLLYTSPSPRDRG